MQNIARGFVMLLGGLGFWAFAFVPVSAALEPHQYYAVTGNQPCAVLNGNCTVAYDAEAINGISGRIDTMQKTVDDIPALRATTKEHKNDINGLTRRLTDFEAAFPINVAQQVLPKLLKEIEELKARVAELEQRTK